MQRLAKFYVGTWDYTETYPKSSFAPNGGKNTGVYLSELGPGGNSLINKFHSRGPVGDFEGMLVMTWDPKEKTYKSYIFGNDYPGALVETGQWDGDTLVYRGEFSMGEMKYCVAQHGQDGGVRQNDGRRIFQHEWRGGSLAGDGRGHQAALTKAGPAGPICCAEGLK